MTVEHKYERIEEDRPAVTVHKPGASLRDVQAAGQWTLIWHRFKRHKLAVISAMILLLFYLVGAFAEFLSPMSPELSRPQYTYAPPQTIGLFIEDENGERRFQPHVKGYSIEVDLDAGRRTFVVDDDEIVPIGFFVAGSSYRLLGLIPMETRLIAPLNAGDPMYLLGTDRLGRDLLSRVIHATRISMSIGLVGVGLTLILGVVLGSLSGYYGGWVDLSIQRLVEVVSSMPTIPLWLGLAAAVPLTWSPIQVYFVITAIVSLLAWTGLAREVRGRFFALRNEDFVTAAKLDGSSERRVIFRHILPSLTSHILAVVTLAIPLMIIAETALSFLGIGLKPPVVSWGVLLQDAQNIRTISTAPWLLVWPAGAVVLAVLSFNFFGDGLRDAADPYDD